MEQAFTEWGLRGVETLRDRVAVLVIVNVMSFSTAVDVAVARGASVIPFPAGDRTAARAAATAAAAVLAEPRSTAGGGYSLSPLSLADLASGARLLLPSSNGSRLSLAGDAVPVLTGCLRNAKAVAAAARVIAREGPLALSRRASCGATAACAPPSKTCSAPGPSSTRSTCRYPLKLGWRATPSVPLSLTSPRSFALGLGPGAD